MSDTDLMTLLKEMDKEFGGGFEVDDGIHFARINRDGCKVFEADGKEPAYILSWKIDGGAFTGKQFGDFLRWHSDDKDKAKIRHGVVTSMVKGVTLNSDESNHPEIQAAYVALLQSKDTEGSIEALGALVASFGDVRMPIRLVTSKTGYQNAKYLEKGKAIVATDPREVEAVAV